MVKVVEVAVGPRVYENSTLPELGEHVRIVLDVTSQGGNRLYEEEPTKLLSAIGAGIALELKDSKVVFVPWSRVYLIESK